MSSDPNSPSVTDSTPTRPQSVIEIVAAYEAMIERAAFVTRYDLDDRERKMARVRLDKQTAYLVVPDADDGRLCYCEREFPAHLLSCMQAEAAAWVLEDIEAEKRRDRENQERWLRDLEKRERHKLAELLAKYGTE